MQEVTGSSPVSPTNSSHDSQPPNVSRTDDAAYRLNQLVMRAELAALRPAGFPRVSHASQ